MDSLKSEQNRQGQRCLNDMTSKILFEKSIEIHLDMTTSTGDMNLTSDLQVGTVAMFSWN